MSFMNSSGSSGYSFQQPANVNSPRGLLTFCKTMSSPLSETLNSSPTSTPTFCRTSFGMVTWYLRVTLVFDVTLTPYYQIVVQANKPFATKDSADASGHIDIGGLSFSCKEVVFLFQFVNKSNVKN